MSPFTQQQLGGAWSHGGYSPRVMAGLQAWWEVKTVSSDLDPRDPFLLSLHKVALLVGLGSLNETWEQGGYLCAETLKYGED